MNGRRIQILVQFVDGSNETTWINADEGAFHVKASPVHGVIIAVAVKAPESTVEFMVPTYAPHRS